MTLIYLELDCGYGIWLVNCTVLTFSHSRGVVERSFCIHCIPSSELIIKQFK